MITSVAIRSPKPLYSGQSRVGRSGQTITLLPSHVEPSRYRPLTGVIRDTFNEKHWKYQEAADHLAISKGTLKRLTMIELSEGAIDIGTVKIGPKKAHTLYTYTDSALRRVHNRMVGGYYGRPTRLSTS